MGHRTDVTELLTDDHRAVQALFAQLERTADYDEQKRIVEEIIVDLVRHTVAEEEYLYPTLRGALADGDELADQALQEHAHAEMVMNRIEDTPPNDVNFHILVRRLINDVRFHAHQEETTVFPRLREALSQDDLAELGTKVAAAKRLAPTRPRPRER